MRGRLAINTHLPGPPALDLAQALGVGMIRVDAKWAMLQPQPDWWDFTLFDQVVQGAQARGLDLYATLSATPAWLAGSAGEATPPPRHLWEAFVGAMLTRYGEAISHWGVWNEPNRLGMYAGTVAGYVDQLLRPAADLIHQSIGACVVAPDLSMEGPWAPWVQTCLQRAGGVVDVISVHSYEETGRAVWRALAQPKRWWDVWKAPSLRQVLQAAGQGGRELWLTESGWWAETEAQEDEQAECLDQLLEGLHGNPWLQRLFYYQLLDEPTEKRGLYRQDLSPKPAVAVLQEAAGMKEGTA